MERSGRHRRNAVEPGQHVVVGRREAGDLERRRDEDRAVEPDARRLLQLAREPSHAVAAVALARDEDRRAPAAVLREPAAHELAQRLEVALVAEVLLRIGRALVRLAAVLAVRLLVRFDHAAEARPHRIDEHEIGEREPRRLVLDEAWRHRRQRPVGREVDALRAHCSHVQVRRCRAGPAVEHERHRAVARAVRGDVGDREDLGRRLLLLAQDGPLARGRVLERLSALSPRPRGLGARGRLVVRLLPVLGVRRLVAHGR